MDAAKLKTSLESDAYVELVEFLNEKLAELKSIDAIKDYSRAQDQAIEVKAVKKAHAKLTEILSQIIAVHDTTAAPAQNSAEDYGLDE